MKRIIVVLNIMLLCGIASEVRGQEYYSGSYVFNIGSNGDDIDSSSTASITFEYEDGTAEDHLAWKFVKSGGGGIIAFFDHKFSVDNPLVQIHVSTNYKRDDTPSGLVGTYSTSVILDEQSYPVLDTIYDTKFLGDTYSENGWLSVSIAPLTRRWEVRTAKPAFYVSSGSYNFLIPSGIYFSRTRPFINVEEVFYLPASITRITTFHQSFPAVLNYPGYGVIHNPDYPLQIEDDYYSETKILNAQCWAFIELKSYVYTIKRLDGDNGILPVDDKIDLWVNENLNEYITWKYSQTVDGTYTDIPNSFKTQKGIKISALDIISNIEDVLEKNIFIKGVIEDVYETETIALQVRLSSPSIISTEAVPPTCNGDLDGKIVLNFNRQLYDKEKLYIGFKDADGAYIILEGNDTIAQLDVVGDGTFSRTIEGVVPGDYHLRLYGTYQYGVNMSDTINTYTGGEHHRDSVTIPDRPALSLNNLTVKDVNCHNGKDGQITVSMSGGTGNFTAFLTGDTILTFTSFSSNYSFTGLRKGSYTLMVEDSNGCRKDSLGNDITRNNIEIKEPNNAVYALRNDIVQGPTFFGGSDGWAKVPYQGGVRPHSAEWEHLSSNVTYTNTIIQDNILFVDTTFVQNLPSGNYKVTVRDANYNAAYALDFSEENICGCYDTITVVVDEPLPLEVDVSELHYVTCYGDNDGELLASATGGRPFESGYPYKYEWYKYTSLTDSVMLSLSDSIATNLISGTYKVKVSDRYGICVLSDAFYLDQPDLLEVKVEVLEEIKCDGQSTGSLRAVVKGGIPPYTILWSTNETTDIISNLPKGNYVVGVRDARYADNINGHYCFAQAVGTISSPNPITINAQVRELRCHNDADAEIILNVEGGVPPYSYLWNDGNTANSRINLTSGTYSVRVTDAMDCFDNREFVLESSEPIIVDLGGDFTLCKDQSIVVDGRINISNANYLWTDENNQTLSTNPEMEINKAGRYRLRVASQEGCVGMDEIVVQQSDIEITPDFVVPTTVANNTPFYAINITRTPADRFEWALPAEAVILENSIDKVQLSFTGNGTYTIGLIGSTSACNISVFKSLQVVDRSAIQEVPASEPFLKRFMAFPNPNNGNFEVIVELREPSDFQLYLYDSFGSLVNTKDVRNSILEMVNYNLTSIKTGLYLLRFVSSETTSTIKIIIQ